MSVIGTYNFCITDGETNIPLPPLRTSHYEYGGEAIPDGLTLYLNPNDASILWALSFDPSLADIGTSTFFFSEINSLTGEVEIVEVVFVVTQCVDGVALSGIIELVDVCCNNPCNIAWYNREGGWQNWIFDGVKTYKVRIGDDGKFKSLGSEGAHYLKNYEVKDVYDAKICTTRDITQDQVDLLDSLRYAIQAMLYNPETENWDIPIVLDKGNYTKYKSRDKFYEVSIQYAIAEEVLIQTQ